MRSGAEIDVTTADHGTGPIGRSANEVGPVRIVPCLGDEGEQDGAAVFVKQDVADLRLLVNLLQGQRDRLAFRQRSGSKP